MSTALQLAEQRKASLYHALEKVRPQIKDIVGGNIQLTSRLVNSAMMVAVGDPKIMETDPKSIVRAVTQAALVGADLASGRGDGYIIPRWNSSTKRVEAGFQDGYGLWRRLMAEAGYTIAAHMIGEKDNFDYNQAPLELLHKSDPFEPCGKWLGGYAAAYRVSAEGTRVLVDAVVMRLDEMDSIREASKKRNKGRESPAWKDFEEMMYLRTCYKRLARKLDLTKSDHLQKLLEIDAHADFDPDLDSIKDLQVLPSTDLEPGLKDFGFAPEEMPEPEVIPPKGEYSDVGPAPWDEGAS